MPLCRHRHSAGAARLRRARLCRRFAASFGLKRELLEQKRNPSGALVGAVPGHYQHSEHSHQSAVIGMPCSPPRPPRRAAHRAQRHTSAAWSWERPPCTSVDTPSPPPRSKEEMPTGPSAERTCRRAAHVVTAAKRAEKRAEHATIAPRACVRRRPRLTATSNRRGDPRHRAPCRHLKP